MPRARSPNSIEAEKLYKGGMKLVDIAKKIGVPDGTVRRWKSTQNWDGDSKKKQSERSEIKEDKDKPSVRKKRGGQPGNQNTKGKQNAKGHGAPKGTQNALKHGGYSSVYWDTLDEEEQMLLEEFPEDEEELLVQQIKLFTVRERRLMKSINKYKEAKGGVYVAGASRFENKRAFKDKEDEELYADIVREKVNNRDRMPGESYQLTTNTSSTVDLVSRLERELTSVQSKKTKAIDSLAHIRAEKHRIAGESKGNELVRTWAQSVLKARGEKNG